MAEVELEREFVGTVTTIQTTYGLVDHSVYFTFSVVQGHKPTRGSQVSVQARRENADAGWIATKVSAVKPELQSDWGQGLTHEQEHKLIIGPVTNAHGLKGKVDGRHEFFEEALSSGYVPCRGDWVRCHLFGCEGSWHVEKVEPTLIRRYEGCVTSTRIPYMIDDEIMFMGWSCARSYRPQEGDRVEGDAIEYDGREGKWRALQVKLMAPTEAGSFRVEESLVKGLESYKISRQQAGTSQQLAVTVVERIDLGSVEVGSTMRNEVSIANNGTSPVRLRSAITVWPDVMLDIVQPCEKTIQPGDAGTVELLLTGRNRGDFEQSIVFDFCTSCISRPLTYSVIGAGERLLAPTTPYQKPVRRAVSYESSAAREDRVVIPGRRLKRGNIEMKYLPCKLKSYLVPEDIRQCCYTEGDVTEIVPELAEELSVANYERRFAALVFLEEVQNAIEMQQFNMDKVRFQPHGPYLSLDVPGIAEGRPSLLLGDCITATIAEEGKHGPMYDGYIHEIIVTPEKQCILLQFSEKFHQLFDDSDYDVNFSIGRTPYKRSHLAIEVAASVGKNFLFPSSFVSNLPLVTISHDDLFNKLLNPRQVAAVSRILSGQARPYPYLLFGPPGTGKTMTLVEAVLQVFLRMPSSRVLVSTPSNSAADLVGVRLLASGLLSPNDMVRFNAYQRGVVPEELEGYCKTVDDVVEAVRYRLVVSTCVTAGMLYSQGLQLGHFSHVFVDEAGQSTEPETMIALGLAANQSGAAVSVLAGDPYQLGPVLQSALACEHGLQVSLLERLIERPIYQRDESKFSDHGAYDPLMVTKLVQNYRCHSSILELFSNIFYHGELEACADVKEQSRFCGWSELPNPYVPIIFHGLEGSDMREGTSPSWFNSAEIVQTADYLKSLLGNSKFGLTVDDIGIITPYRKQVEKMRQFLATVALDNVKVGSVEEFQGQERPVIIVSTVRSRGSLLSFDKKHQIGFLANPKRFNVSISRAKSLMIVVGNPHILAQDQFWRILLMYCVCNNAYRGCSLPALNAATSTLFTDADQGEYNEDELPDLE